MPRWDLVSIAGLLLALAACSPGQPRITRIPPPSSPPPAARTVETDPRLVTRTQPPPTQPPAAAPQPAAQPPVGAAPPVAAVPGRVWLGNEVLAASGFRELRGKRVGLITNPSGVNRQLRSTLDLLRSAPGLKLVALFAPEHGLQGSLPAGREFPDQMDPRTGLPVFSLYGPGPVRAPTAKMLQGLDALVYDVQDTGCRSYTYIATMGLAMEACAIAGVEFVVLDRPNPLGGLRVEGPRLSAQFLQIKSLVSRWDVPYVYGMTCGELARMINSERWIARPCRLTVIPMQGWDRRMVWRDTGLSWVPTSPRITRAESAMYYVATGVLGEIGGVNIGTTLNMAFECITAPWLDGVKLSRQLAAYQLPGVNFVPLKVNSASGPLSGVRIVFSDPNRTPLLPINFYALEAIKRVSGRDLFTEAQRAGKVFSMFDRVNGTEATRLALQAKRPVAEIVQSWQISEQLFRQQRQKYLLY